MYLDYSTVKKKVDFWNLRHRFFLAELLILVFVRHLDVVEKVPYFIEYIRLTSGNNSVL